MPIFTCVLAFPVEGKVPKPLELLSLTILSMGIIVCVWKNDTGGSVQAMTLCLLATISNSAMSCFSGKVMSEAVDALQLIFLTAPFSLGFLLPHLIFKEVGELQHVLAARRTTPLTTLQGIGWHSQASILVEYFNHFAELLTKSCNFCSSEVYKSCTCFRCPKSISQRNKKETKFVCFHFKQSEICLDWSFNCAIWTFTR